MARQVRHSTGARRSGNGADTRYPSKPGQAAQRASASLSPRTAAGTKMQIPLMPDGRWGPVPEISGVPAGRCREGAFVPPPLPADLMLPSTTYRRAAEAEYALGRLDATARQLVAPHGLVRSTQLRDAQSSASLDGVYLSLKEVLVADLLTSQDSVRHSDLLRRITPYLQAYRHGHRCVRAGAAIDAAVMRELTAIMTGRPDPLRTDRGVLTTGTAEPYLLTAAG